MKKQIAIILAFMLLFTACGKKDAAPAQSATQPTTAPGMQETVSQETTQPTTEATTVPTEPAPDVNSVEIDGDVYTLPLYVTDLLDNGWDIYSYADTFESATVAWMTRGDYELSVDIEDTSASGSEISLRDPNVMIVHFGSFYQDETCPSVIFAEGLTSGMGYAEAVAQMETLGFTDMETYETSYGYVVVGNQDLYGITVYVENDIVTSMSISVY